MKIKTLKIFLDLAESKNFSKTAQLNSISQPAVSQQIRALESELNSPLIETINKKFTLSPQGNILRKYAQRILQEYNSFLHEAQQNSFKHTCSEFSIAASYLARFYLIPTILRSMLKQFSDSNIELKYISNNSEIDNLKNTHLIISETLLESPNFYSGVLAHSELIVIASPFFLKKDEIFLQDVSIFPLVGFSPISTIREFIDKLAKKESIHLEYFREYDNIDLIKQAVLASPSIAIIPKICLQEEEKHTYRCLPLKDIQEKLPIYYAYNPINSPEQLYTFLKNLPKT